MKTRITPFVRLDGDVDFTTTVFASLAEQTVYLYGIPKERQYFLVHAEGSVDEYDGSSLPCGMIVAFDGLGVVRASESKDPIFRVLDFNGDPHYIEPGQLTAIPCKLDFLA